MDYPDILHLTVALSLPLDSFKNRIGTSIYTYATLLPTTYKLIDLVSKLSRYSCNTSASFAMIDTNI